MKKIFLFVAFIALAFAVRGKNGDYELTPEQKMTYAERIIETYYLEDVDGNKLADEAIRAMLKTLDPHSAYSDPQETEELTQPLDGNFSGIGVMFNMLNDTLYITQTVAGGPSEKVGILAGDRILFAGDSIISGAKKSNSDIIKMLRGPKGTQVDLIVKRRGVDEPLKFKVVRDDIPLYSIDAAYLAAPGVGYIKISRFGEKTDEEFIQALEKLTALGMKDLIVDLEDNGGGYLGSAVALASHFLNKGDLVTYTDSPKLGRSDFKVEKKGSNTDGKLVVMVNQFSASASEIFSGAVQDNDRGLIVGRRTYGKGLVQRPFPMPDGSMIRLTISRYHTPTGRSIQKPYVDGDGEDYNLDILRRYEAGEFMSADNIEFPDSLKYYTLRNHREVYGGGGIMPDLFVPVDTMGYSRYYRDLVGGGEIIKTALTYVENNKQTLLSKYPDIDVFMAQFDPSDELMQQIVANGEADGIPYVEDQYLTSEDLIKTILKGLIARDTYDKEDYFKIVYSKYNPTYQKALELIGDDGQYSQLLKNGRQSESKK